MINDIFYSRPVQLIGFGFYGLLRLLVGAFLLRVAVVTSDLGFALSLSTPGQHEVHHYDRYLPPVLFDSSPAALSPSHAQEQACSTTDHIHSTSLTTPHTMESSSNDNSQTRGPPPTQTDQTPQQGTLALNVPPSRTPPRPSQTFTATIDSPTTGTSASRAPLTPLPPPPSTLIQDGAIYRHWLNAKTWEDRRMQETQRTKQEALKLEQRKYELSMLRDALRAGVPLHLVPVLFGGAAPPSRSGGEGLGVGGSEGMMNARMERGMGIGMGMGMETGMSRREGVERAFSRWEGMERARSRREALERAHSRREGMGRTHSRREGMDRALSTREANVPAPGPAPAQTTVPAPAAASVPPTAPAPGPGPTPNTMRVHGVVAPLSGRSSTRDADRVRRQVQFLNSGGQDPPAPELRVSGHRSRHHHRENGHAYTQAEMERRDQEIAQLQRTRDELEQEKQYVQLLAEQHARLHEHERRYERGQAPSLCQSPTAAKVKHSDNMSMDDPTPSFLWSSRPW